MLRVNDFERTLLTTAMAQLIFDDQDYLRKGVSHQKLLKALTSAKENGGYSKKFLEGIIQREYENSGLIKMDNGNYSLGPRDGRVDNEIEFLDTNADSSNTRMGSSNNSSACSSPRRGKLKPAMKKSVIMKKALSSLAKMDAKRMAVPRVGERRKRAKKVFDPSENNLPKRKRGRPIGSLNKTTLKKQCNSLSTSTIKTLKVYEAKSKCESVGSSNDDETNESNSLILSDVGNKVAGGVCSVCRQYAKDGNEKLVGCRDCSNKAHPQCLQGDGMLRLRPDNTWQCPHCKTCVVCIETMDAGILTVCHICSDAYHQLCHTPNIPETLKAWNMWECKNCLHTKNSNQNIDSTYIDKVPGSDRSSKLSDKSDSINSTLDRRRDRQTAKRSSSEEKKADSDPSYSPPYNLKSSIKWQGGSPVYDWQDDSPEMKKEDGSYDGKKDVSTPESENGNSASGENHIMNKIYSKKIFAKNSNMKDNGDIDPSIPDASCWTCSDVYNYFSSYFPEHAHVFDEQKIDGASLMIMRRYDVLTYLGLELGPALKIYRHIVKLQSRKDDIKMCWF